MSYIYVPDEYQGELRVLPENPAAAEGLLKAWEHDALDEEYQKRMDPFANLQPSVTQQQADAQAQLNAAHNDAAALLAELDAKANANAVAASVDNGKPKYTMPSKYAPGEDPAERDPVQSIANTTAVQRITPQQAQEQMFKAVDPGKAKETTLP